MGAFRDDAWVEWRGGRTIHPDFEALTEVGFKAGFDAGYDKATEQTMRVGDYIMSRFPDLTWCEYSDPITALCDRLAGAEEALQW